MGQESAMDLGGAGAREASAGTGSLIGTHVAGKYRVDSLIGSGSTGDVYLCTHTGLDKVVALKVLHADMVKHANFVERFKREARAASRLEHPNSVRVLDFGEDPGGVLYIAMEYIAGRDLWSVLDEEWPLDNSRIVDIMSQVLAALGTAHNLGIVHRDLKPENIMVRRAITDDGEKDLVTVCDFGIAQLSPIQLAGSFSELTSVVTGDGMVVGTPAYMSPEQARAEPLDARSDIYSAGVVLFQVLTRQLPFTAETPLAVAVMHCAETPPAPSQLALVHPRLEAACLKALSKTREARFQTAREMQLALNAVLVATSAPFGADPRLNGGRIARKLRKPYLPLAPLLAVSGFSSARSERSVRAESRTPSHVTLTSRVPDRVPSSLTPVERDRPTDPPPKPRESDGNRLRTAGAVFGVLLFGGLSVSQLMREPEPASSRGVPLAQPSEPPGIAFGRAGMPEVPPGAGAPTLVSAPKSALEIRARPEPPFVPAYVPPPELDGRVQAKQHAQRTAATPPRRTRTDQPSGSVETEDVSAISSVPAGSDSQSAHETSPASASSSAANASVRAPAGDSSPSMAAMSNPQPLKPVAAAPRPVVVGSGSFDQASVQVSRIETQAGVSRASIRNALNQSAMSRCYRDSLKLGAARPIPMIAELDLATNMAGRITSAVMRGGGLPSSLQHCLEQVVRAGRVREVDTGTARASITLQLQP